MNITKEQIEDWLKDNCSYLLGTQYEKVIFDCIKNLSPKWVSLDNPPKINCMAWVKRGPYLEVYEYYICPEYQYGSWLDENKDDIELSDGEWMLIPDPK